MKCHFTGLDLVFWFDIVHGYILQGNVMPKELQLLSTLKLPIGL